MPPVSWPDSPFGAEPAWPAGVSALLGTIFGAPMPMALAYGPDFRLIYNEPYGRILGAKHPATVGRPASEALSENWSLPGHGDVVEAVFRTGEPFVEVDTVLPVQRGAPGSPMERVHFSRSYTAVRDDSGAIIGVLAVVVETSEVTRTLTGLAELATRLAVALSVDDVARDALRYAVETVHADHARVLLAEGPALRMARRAGADIGDESIDRLPPLWSRMRPDSRLPSVEVVRTGRPLWLAHDEVGQYSGLQDEPSGARLLRSVAAVPLSAGQVAGALSLGWERARTFGEGERAALMTVGNLIGSAMARARRFDEQRGNAETLQRSMLPAELPHIAGVSIGARYIPSAPGTSAGGDFYDAFLLEDGRVFLAIGDVVGHGVLAAAVMGQVRAGLRVLALRRPDPVQVLAGLDAFVASLGTEMFATALVAVLDPDDGAIELAAAGHPAPMVRRATDTQFLPVVAGPPLGIAAARTAYRTQLHQDDVFVLYTDGLVEVPGQSLDVGLGELAALVDRRRDIADPRRFCSLLLGELGVGTDDTAVMVLTRDEGLRRTAALDVPAESTAPGAARTWVRRVLRTWIVDDEVCQRALLGVNELVTNALLHARSPAHVELDLDERRLLVLVTDRGLGSAVAIQDTDPGAVRGRGLALVEAVADAWGNERTSRGTTVWFELSMDREDPAA
jgi:anti-sigma regulatory factor (Ser/Thr protein kinase)/GAF domain-containing protein